MSIADKTTETPDLIETAPTGNVTQHSLKGVKIAMDIRKYRVTHSNYYSNFRHHSLDNTIESGYNLYMKISELGEFGLIELISGKVGKTSGDTVLIGIGDDAACWRAECMQPATTDTLIEDIHFIFKNISWRELGWKAMAVNLSDIAAMGGRPRYALVSLGIPAVTETEDIVELYKGMTELAKKYDVRIVGGDMVVHPQL